MKPSDIFSRANYFQLLRTMKHTHAPYCFGNAISKQLFFYTCATLGAFSLISIESHRIIHSTFVHLSHDLLHIRSKPHDGHKIIVCMFFTVGIAYFFLGLSTCYRPPQQFMSGLCYLCRICKKRCSAAHTISICLYRQFFFSNNTNTLHFLVLEKLLKTMFLSFEQFRNV